MDQPELVDVTAARVLGRDILKLTFDTGELRVLDVEPMMWGPVFEPLLADYATFCQVRVNAEAGTIVWPNRADLSPTLLYEQSKPALPA